MSKTYKVNHAGKEILVNQAYKDKYDGELTVIEEIDNGDVTIVDKGEVKEVKNKNATSTPAPPPPAGK